MFKDEGAILIAAAILARPLGPEQLGRAGAARPVTPGRATAQRLKLMLKAMAEERIIDDPFKDEIIADLPEEGD